MTAETTASERAAWMHKREGVAALLGITIVEVSEGATRVSLKLRADMTNGFESAHGGIIFTLADTAFCLCL